MGNIRDPYAVAVKKEQTTLASGPFGSGSCESR